MKYNGNFKSRLYSYYIFAKRNSNFIYYVYVGWILCKIISNFSFSKQYDEGIHPGYMDGSAAGGLYEPHVAHRPGLQGLHHSPHLNHAMHPYHTNHVNPAANHVMGGAVPDVGKRDKDAIYG